MRQTNLWLPVYKLEFIAVSLLYKTDRYILFPVINVINQGRYGCTYITTMIIIIM